MQSRERKVSSAGILEQSMGAKNRVGIGFRTGPPETVFLNF